jgi:hypothetical protein
MRQKLGSQAYQTFQVVSPKETHTRKASCEEVECESYARGWRMTLDLGTPLGVQQAQYIKHRSGRAFTVTFQEAGMVTLEFRANQPCFADHRVSNGRPELYRVKGGDRRGNPLGVQTRVHDRPEHWVEEFAENQERLVRLHQRG